MLGRRISCPTIRAANFNSRHKVTQSWLKLTVTLCGLLGTLVGTSLPASGASSNQTINQEHGQQEQPQKDDYRLSLYGPHTLYPGYDSYVRLSVSYTGKIDHVYFNDLSAPSGITVSVICSSMPCWKKAKDSRMFQWNATHKLMPVLLHLQAAVGVVPGNYKVIVTTEVADVVHRIDVDLKVLPVPLLGPSHSAFHPPIPGLARWRAEMLKLASKWCDPKKVYSFGYEGEVWYYDGARVFFQIADYTHDGSWSACALNIAKQYAAFVTSHDGRLPGWRVFPQGLRMAYERTRGDEYKNAVILLARNSSFADKGGNIDDYYIRETAYALQAYIQAEQLGQSRNPNLIRSADFILGMFEVIFDQHAYTIHQAFFDGLAAAALIEYYDLTGDPRVPPSIKLMLDWVWNTAWNRRSHCLVWGVVDGPRANPSCQNALNNLVAPAFAWYYNVTGNADPTYLKAGDEMFSHALDTNIGYSGKIFSQNYRWSFDYVLWRSNPINHRPN